jgi:hypothetical protein
MTLGKRLDRLEGTALPRLRALDIDLPPDLCARINAAQAAGTFPQSLSTDDLMVVQHAINLVKDGA